MASQVNRSGLVKASAEDRDFYNTAQVPGLSLNRTLEEWAEGAWVGFPGEPGQVNEGPGMHSGSLKTQHLA